MRVEISIYSEGTDEREQAEATYHIELQSWLEQDQYARGEKPQPPKHGAKFAPGKVKVEGGVLLSFYVVDPNIIRIETKNGYYNVKNTSEVLDKLEKLIED